MTSNIAIGSLPTLQISLGIGALFEKIYDGELIPNVVSNIGEDVQFQSSLWCEKCVAARHFADIGKQLFFANKRNRIRWVVLGLSQNEPCTDLSENFSEDSLLKGRPIKW